METASIVAANPEATGNINPLLRVAAKLGEVARGAYVRLGMTQAGVRPEAPTAEAATGESRWGTLLQRGGNIVQWTTAAALIGGIAISKVVAARHGMETGGGNGGFNMQNVADVAPFGGGGGNGSGIIETLANGGAAQTLAESAGGNEESAALKALLITGGILGGGPALALFVRNRIHHARADRDEAVRTTRQQPRIPDPTPHHPGRTRPQPSAEQVIQDRANAANAAQLARWSDRRTGVPLDFIPGATHHPAHIDDTLRRYRPHERIPAVGHPAPRHIWRYLFGRRGH
jgi:hypothetical protein